MNRFFHIFNLILIQLCTNSLEMIFHLKGILKLY
ncbi:hypothetical protein vBEcoMWL3_gp156 [Escherichia phage vB_EcoM_WL-3]|nr:hypothetical protein vBEcoMWL3_gp156 [Escherichia phage vB_EcoM_WL-3]